MKPTRIFIVSALLLSFAFLISTLTPNRTHAIPRAPATGEYPDAIGARCADVDYAKTNTTSSENQVVASVSSPNPNGVTPVHIGVYVEQITGVDEGANSYGMQGFLDLIWCDPRLSFDAADAQPQIYLEDDAHEKLNHVWWPNLEFVNEDEPVSMENLTLLIHPDGTVEFRSKFSGRFASNFNLHAFPFDQQDIEVEIESFEWANDKMQFLDQQGIVGFSEEFFIPEWNVTDIHEQVVNKKEVRDLNEFSKLIATLHLKRDPGVYVTKVMIPLGVIILISMIIFWMDVEAFEDRLGASMTGLLTAVAYQFIASQNLPKHVYNTYLDSFVFLSFLIILLGIGESGYGKWLCDNDKQTQAVQLDQASRWFIPLLYIGMMIALYFLYTR